MKLNKPKFWDNKIGFLSVILFPLSLIFIFVTHLNRKISKRKVFKLPIIFTLFNFGYEIVAFALYLKNKKQLKLTKEK